MEPRSKRSWPAVAIRVFAVLNLLMGLVGLAALSGSIANTLKYNLWDQDPPYYAQAYYIRSGINLVFVILTILGAFHLWHVRRRGWAMCKVLFIGQIAYFFIGWFDFLLYWILGDRAALVLKAFGASGGTGNMGTAIQIIAGYPVIALIGLKIAFGRLSRVPTPGERTPQAGSHHGQRLPDRGFLSTGKAHGESQDD